MDRHPADDPDDLPLLESEDFLDHETVGEAPLAHVAVTGVGGIVGQSIIKALSDTPYPVLGFDASEMAAGLYAVPKGYVVPKSKDASYVDRILEICVAEEIGYLFLGLDMELPIFARAASRFREAGVIPIISPTEVIDLGDDKLETVRFLESLGLPAPQTFDYSEDAVREIGFPLVLKPRKEGSRSQGVFIVRNEAELRAAAPQINKANCVVQECIEGDEYSCGSITFNGDCRGVMVMKRTLRDGDTHKAHIIRHPKIEAHVKKVAEALKPFGPCNFQLRLRNGIPYIFEINPRFSGGTAIRALAGFNEPLMTLEFLERGIPPSFTIRPVSIFRYWKEIVVDARKVNDVRKCGSVENTDLGL
jgi:carbamoyl-phosphate synthase large subunit